MAPDMPNDSDAAGQSARGIRSKARGGMMESVIKEVPQLVLAGFSFFGNPFHFSSDWTEENEIGRLWKRFMQYWPAHPEYFPPSAVQKGMLELHILHADSQKNGEYEVFTGILLEQARQMPAELSLKILPPITCAVFTLHGAEIQSDWAREIFTDWMAASPYESGANYSIEWYDERYKGLDRIEESVLDVYVPVRLRRPDDGAA
jgi:AraC family transcriptional regulator